eukprot:s4789_g4.t1
MRPFHSWLRGKGQCSGWLGDAGGYGDRNLNDICLEYTYEELKQATNNFDETHMKLGRIPSKDWSAGQLQIRESLVVKGQSQVPDGTEVAIKVLDVPNEAGFEEEVKVLSKFRHPHLVILMGWALSGALKGFRRLPLTRSGSQ